MHGLALLEEDESAGEPLTGGAQFIEVGAGLRGVAVALQAIPANGVIA